MTTARLIYCLAVSYQETARSQGVHLCVFKFRSTLTQFSTQQSLWFALFNPSTLCNVVHVVQI